MQVTLVISAMGAGGAERVVATLANHWAQRGWTVHLLTFDSERPFYSLHATVRHCALGISGKTRGVLHKLIANFARVYALRRAIRKTKPEVVVSLLSETNVLTILATFGMGVPVVVQEQNNPYEEKLDRGWDTLRRWTYPFAACVVTLNHRSLTYFSEKVRRRARIIPNFAAVSGEARMPFAKNGHPKTLMAMGRLAPQKGFDMLLQAYAKIACKHPQWGLEILGEGELRGDLELLANDLGIGERVRMPGTTKEPFDKLRKADLFVMPSRYEGFPLSLCEAMACGLPAISFDCPTGPSDIIRHGVDGLLVKPGDVCALSQAMDELMSDEKERETLASNAPEVLQRYGVQAVMSMWDALVSEVTIERGQQEGGRREEPIRVFFLIRSLGHGGAERQLTELVKRLRGSRLQVTVATFYDGGLFRAEIEGLAGVRVLSLGKRSRWDALSTLWRLARAIKDTEPHIIHGYMGVANELALLMGRAFGARVVWGIRASQVDKSQQEWLSAVCLRVGAWLSRFADVIIANSHAGREHYAADGYCEKRLTVISNGIDTERFCPNESARWSVREGWGVAETERLIGLVGRINPQKDHPTFLRAAALLAGRLPSVRFVCVGNGDEGYRDELERLASELNLDARVIWIRASNNMPDVYNALDLLVLPSAYGEGFPNVVGEAMSSGVPVVVTDVGDSAMVVDNAAQIVPPKDPEALAEAMERVLRLGIEERAALVSAHRDRIVREFSLDQLTTKTMAALEGIV